jgi:pimeloyl-ACP methyl ester carboxylesterase
MTIVLLPGLSGSTAADFAFVSPMLARRRAVVSIDLPPEPGFDDLVDHVRRRLPGGDLTLVGYSIGAAVAIALAAGTAAVTRLVLVSSPLRGGERERRFAATWAALAPAARRDFERFAALADDGAGAAEPGAADGLAPFDGALVARLPAIDVAAAAAAITAPTLVVSGASDAILGTGCATALFGAIAPARLAVVDGGHALLHESPAHVLSLIDSFDRDPERHRAGSLLPAETP